MPSQVPRERLQDSNMNFVAAKSVGRIPRYAGGGHGAGAIVSMEEIPIISAEQMATMEQEQIMDGIEAFASKNPNHGSTGFGGYFKETAAKSEMPIDMANALAENESEPEFSQQERRHQDEGGDLDNSMQGESPASGHEQVAAGKFGYKQKVYIASLDVLASVYEDNGATVTVKTVHGKWLDLSKKDIQPIDTNVGESVNAEVAPVLSPRKRDNGGSINRMDQDEDATSMNSYAERRRAKRSA